MYWLPRNCYLVIVYRELSVSPECFARTAVDMYWLPRDCSSPFCLGFVGQELCIHTHTVTHTLTHTHTHTHTHTNTHTLTHTHPHLFTRAITHTHRHSHVTHIRTRVNVRRGAATSVSRANDRIQATRKPDQQRSAVDPVRDATVGSTPARDRIKDRFSGLPV